MSAALSALVVLLGCTAANGGESSAVIPMNLDMGRPVIEVSLNGKGPYRFIFDTGAAVNLVDSALAAELDLQTTREENIGIPGSEVQVARPVVLARELSVVNLRYGDVEMISMDLRSLIPIDGIMGVGQFADYLINLDYPAKQIVLQKGTLNAGTHTVRYDTAQGILAVPLTVGERTWLAHLDSGSPAGFTFPYRYKDSLKLTSEPEALAGRSKTLTVQGGNWKANLDEDIRLAGLEYPSPSIVLSEILGEFVNVGYRVMKDLSIVIDTRSGLVQIEKTESSANPTANIEIGKPDDTRKSKAEGEPHKFSGRYGGVRTVSYAEGQLYIQRDGGPKLKLEPGADSLYHMQLPGNARPMNELPSVRFETGGNQVRGMTFIFQDGREEFVKKD